MFYVPWTFFLTLTFVGCCRIQGCSNAPEVRHYFVGTVIVITTKCQAGYIFKFATSREVNGLYANNLQSAGNNFSKVNRMSEFLGLSFLSEATFYRIQRLYLFPAVEEWWNWMRDELVKEFVDQKVVVGEMGSVTRLGLLPRTCVIF